MILQGSLLINSDLWKTYFYIRCGMTPATNTSKLRRKIIYTDCTVIYKNNQKIACFFEIFIQITLWKTSRFWCIICIQRVAHVRNSSCGWATFLFLIGGKADEVDISSLYLPNSAFYAEKRCRTWLCSEASGAGIWNGIIHSTELLNRQHRRTVLSL